MTTNRFPLLRIPFLALRRILDFYGPHEIIQLSLCSKRSQRVAKQCWKKKGSVRAFLTVGTVPSINLFFHSEAFYYCFFISGVKDIQDKQVHNIRVGDAVVPSIHESTDTVTFWNDKLFGIEQIVSYIKYLFDEPIHSICLAIEKNHNDFLSTIDCIMSRQESIRECTLHGQRAPIDGCLTHLLDNCEVTENLNIYGEPSSQFSNSWNITLDDLYITNGLSITLQNLTNINCQSLELCSSSLTSKDLNQFLKNWQKGENSRLKFLSIRINSIDEEAITSGIHTSLRRVNRYYRGIHNSKILKFGGLDIQRNDGKTGSIYFWANAFEFGVDPIQD